MKKLITICAVATMIFAISGITQAELTYRFNPNDLIDLYDQGPPLGTPDPTNPRSVYTGGEGTLYPGYQGIGNWNTQGYGSARDLAIKSDYLKWRDADGGYITQFNIWLADNPKARGWGEQLVLKPYETPVSGTASAGWSVEVIGNPWHDEYLMVQWTADDVSKALKIGGPDICHFSFTATLYVDENENGWDEDDPLATLGEDYTVWFGGYGVGTDTISHESGDILFQGTLDITTIPEPTTICLLGLGVLSLLRRKK
jgi:hypothetical protein